MSIDLIQLWHERARPNPDDKAFNVQLGCHFEEIAEMLNCLRGHNDAADANLERVFLAIEDLANDLKSGEIWVDVDPFIRGEFLDSLADQIVTATGVGHCAKMNITEAVRRVNTSNWTKYVDGKPLFNQHGKIIKPEGYVPPDLSGLF